MQKSMNPLDAATIRTRLKADCSQCFGLCCTALNLIASSDFAINKPAGVPCPNLQDDFRCGIHSNLRESGFKGCTAFDCLGAGQHISQSTFEGKNWRDHPEIAEKMFLVLPVMEQLFEMIAFLSEALSFNIDDKMRQDLSRQLDILERATHLQADDLLQLDIVSYRFPVNELLTKTSHHIRQQYDHRSPVSLRLDWMGKKFIGKDLRGFDLRGALLIAADFQHADMREVDLIGADLRDANLSGANLSTSLFLTQMQINSAKGNAKTQLPYHLTRPFHWSA